MIFYRVRPDPDRESSSVR